MAVGPFSYPTLFPTRAAFYESTALLGALSGGIFLVCSGLGFLGQFRPESYAALATSAFCFSLT
jgi:hypothetical protein